MTSNEQKRYLEDFLESDCSLFSYADFEFYSEKTGKSITELYQMANFSQSANERLENAILDADFDLVDLILSNM